MSKSPALLAGYITAEELAVELNKSPLTLRRWRRSKRGPPFIRTGREVFYSRESVRRWLERLESKPQF
jgi:hypothetical protein